MSTGWLVEFFFSGFGTSDVWLGCQVEILEIYGNNMSTCFSENHIRPKCTGYHVEMIFGRNRKYFQEIAKFCVIEMSCDTTLTSLTSVRSFSWRRNSLEKSRSLRGTLRGRSLHGGRSSELSRTLFGTLFPWLGRSVFAKIAKKALFPAKTAVFAGKNGFFADFREKVRQNTPFSSKK